jgi:hypothetical protein
MFKFTHCGAMLWPRKLGINCTAVLYFPSDGGLTGFRTRSDAQSDSISQLVIDYCQWGVVTVPKPEIDDQANQLAVIDYI